MTRDPLAMARGGARLGVLIPAVAGVVFALDLLLPLGVAAGVPYVALVLLAARQEEPGRTWQLAVVGTVLTLVGAVLSPGTQAVVWVYVTNRMLALFAIWALAAGIVRWQQARLEVREYVRELRQMQFALDQSAIVAATDVHGRITYVNDRFCEISGYSRDELIGRDHRVVNSGVHPKTFWAEMWRTALSGEVWRAEVCNRAKDGALYWVDTTVVPVVDPLGRPEAFMAIRQDVTARHHAERKLADQAALATLGTLAATVAHEVRNPLAGMGGALQVLRRRMPEEAPERQILGDVLDRIDVLNNRLEDILVYARPMDPRLEEVELLALAERIAAQLRSDPRTDSARIVVGGEAVTVRADADLLDAALLNAILNAVQAGAEHVTLTVGPTPTGARLQVADDGPGIPPALRVRVFEPFVTSKSSGTGLGLPVIQRTFEAHGGAIRLICPPEGGTQLTAELPAEGPRPTSPPSSDPESPVVQAIPAAALAAPALDKRLSRMAHDIKNPLTGLRGVIDNMRRGRVPEERLPEYLDAASEAVDRIGRIVEDTRADLGAAASGTAVARNNGMDHDGMNRSDPPAAKQVSS